MELRRKGHEKQGQEDEYKREIDAFEKKIQSEVSSQLGYVSGYFMSSGRQQQIEKDTRRKHEAELTAIK